MAIHMIHILIHIFSVKIFYGKIIQSNPIASVIDAEELFSASASITDAIIFWKTKIYKSFVDFCFPKSLTTFYYYFLYNKQ